MMIEPLIILYTSDENVNESKRLEELLVQSSVSFETRNVSINPEYFADLIKRFGGEVSIPGMTCGGKWIPGDDEEIGGILGHYSVDYRTTDEKRGRVFAQQETTINFGAPPAPPTPPDIQLSKAQQQQQQQQQQLQWKNPGSGPIKARSLCSGYQKIESTIPDSNSTLYSDPTLTLETATETTGLFISQSIRLPNGKSTSAGDLLRILLKATDHHFEKRSPQPISYFHGYEGMKLWAKLFGNTSEIDLIRFGETLIDRGLLHEYTPMYADFRKKFLVLYPLKEPQVLNGFIKWPTPPSTGHNDVHRGDEDPMDIIIRLSRDMDEFCATEGSTEELNNKWHDLEESVCQLQVVRFRGTNVEHVTFAVNLYNLIMRHAMIAWDLKGWSWPNTLDHVQPMLSRLGYKVGGEWVSLASLQTKLYGHEGNESLPGLIWRDPAPRTWLQQMLCRDIQKPTDHHYESPVLRDPNHTLILFATAWMTRISPAAATLYPNRLAEGLKTAADLYCQSNVKIGSDSVILPPVLSWYRADFNYRPEQVLFNILPFLTHTQLEKVRTLKNERVRFPIIFDGDGFFTAQGLPAPTLFPVATTTPKKETGRRRTCSTTPTEPSVGFPVSEESRPEEATPPAPSSRPTANDKRKKGPVAPSPAVLLRCNKSKQKGTVSGSSVSNIRLSRLICARRPSLGEDQPAMQQQLRRQPPQKISSRPSSPSKTDTSYDDEFFVFFDRPDPIGSSDRSNKTSAGLQQHHHQQQHHQQQHRHQPRQGGMHLNPVAEEDDDDNENEGAINYHFLGQNKNNINQYAGDGGASTCDLSEFTMGSEFDDIRMHIAEADEDDAYDLQHYEYVDDDADTDVDVEYDDDGNLYEFDDEFSFDFMQMGPLQSRSGPRASF